MLSRRCSTSLITLITLLICFALLSSKFAPFAIGEAKSLAGTGHAQSGRGRPQHGPPVGNLPNLDEVRSNDTSKANTGNDRVGSDVQVRCFVSFKHHRQIQQRVK